MIRQAADARSHRRERGCAEAKGFEVPLLVPSQQ